MAQTTLWGRVRSGSKKGFDASWKALDKLGAPVNKLSNKLGSEAFWPTSIDKECDKAARILKSFCKDGFYAEEEKPAQDGPKQKQRVIKKIPESVIRNAKGLAIFTTMRTGLWISGAGGSGVLVGRLPDGSWSPPSGILLHTAGLGFLVGVDIYDCVVVINSESAMQAFMSTRCTLGGEISVVAGPVGAGALLETELHKRQAPIFTYLKSRGFYAGVQIDGTVIIERSDENERFYGHRYSVKEIMAGNVGKVPDEVRRLRETIKAAQGDSNVDESALPTEPPPGDYVIEDGHVFGVPAKEDPDPYGVLALEKEGLGVKEAGTHKNASWEQFSFNPSPTSPVHRVYQRDSQDVTRLASGRSSWRASAFANEMKSPSSLRNSVDRLPLSKPPSLYTDTATQTDLPHDEPQSPSRWSSKSGLSRRSSRDSSHMPHVPENSVPSTSPSRKEPRNASRANGYSTPPHTPPMNAANEDHEEDDVHIEEPVVHSIQTAQPASPQVVSKVRLVNVPRRGPPPVLPPRNPQRSGPVVVGASLVPAQATVPEAESSTLETKSAMGESSARPEQGPDSLAEDKGEGAKNDALKVQQSVDDVKLDDEEDEHMTNPWARVEEARKRESQNSSPMPGGW
ncbi:hypothetical protein LTR54_014268 [Friedmanniomyces endolithicus]|uniref:Ysc84 actin-binding domain-containing protein n=1 Tax=Friedmanniomyces endolithicus TaxID=329885 RepID=A0AAN6FC21_9PEZI|nr:hypothetical protein LTS00_016041 [Friedmanniomyces endolithicus]KAK0311747.1 hypothetical protein LTR82_014119 [Friedmanniomyces endolithicus]KAK0983603.1 hypothetical protein LTR54_014268 [Friedmanniomyces endolithicus]